MMTEQGDVWGQLLLAGSAGDARADARFLQAALRAVLLAVHRKRQTPKPDSPVRPWLRGITRYKVIDACRAQGRKSVVSIDDFAEVLAADAGSDPTEAADRARMTGLPDGRSAMIDLQGVSVAGAGSALTMREGAVRVALHRVVKTMAILRERHVK